MKKQSAAVLLILSCLLLSGCRVAPAGETGAPPPVPETPSITPLISPTPMPTPTPETEEPGRETSTPAAPVDKAEEVTAAPELPGMNEEARYQFALDWCEAHKNEFHHAGLYAMDRGYWFADWAPDVTEIPFEGGNVYFYEDTAGTMTPEEVVEAVFRRAGACFETRTPEDWAAAKERIARRAAETTAEDEEALNLFLAGELAAYPDYYLGIGEDMWICGAVSQTELESGWYVMMKLGTVYRIQWDRAFEDYIRLPEVQIRIAFDQALEAYRWFGSAVLPSDPEDLRQTEDDGRSWNRVEYPGISSQLEMRTHLKSLFSDEVVDRLLAAGFYREFDGVLYVSPPDAEYVSWDSADARVLRESETKLVYQLEGTLFPDDPNAEPVQAALDFPYEKVGDKWVFTEFNWPG